ncbi:MAG: hypothetical protein R3F59_33560 [Myxococcota bacterium]
MAPSTSNSTNDAASLESRLAIVEQALSKRRRWYDHVYYLTKAVIQWPFFALCVLFMFYRPAYSILNTFDEKVRDATDVGLGSMSLRTRIKRVALFDGMGMVGERVVKLSDDAIIELLRSEDMKMDIDPFYEPVNRRWAGFRFPTDRRFNAISELISAELMTIKEGYDTIDEARRMINATLSKYDGKRKPLGDGFEQYLFQIPVEGQSIAPLLTLRTTEGEVAKSLIMDAVLGGLRANAYDEATSQTTPPSPE